LEGEPPWFVELRWGLIPSWAKDPTSELPSIVARRRVDTVLSADTAAPRHALTSVMAHFPFRPSVEVLDQPVRLGGRAAAAAH
jgi:hypothetical protein